MTQPNSPQTPISTSPDIMPPAFEPHPIEARWYSSWQDAGLFALPANPSSQQSFVITIPPPNVTGVLHLGHALQHSIHDCLLRYHRMKGERAVCVPGTDHAGISTQIKVKDLLWEEEKKTLHDLSREEFVTRAWNWKAKYGGIIIEQMKALGCSYDWSRERFTMDEGYSRAVLTVFKKLYDEGFIYRGFRLINWSPGAQTTVSDLEIEYRDVQGSLWHFKYPVENSSEFIIVATTRPETMLGDTAVAVHPDDERYKHLVGKNVMLPLMNRAIPIVADQYVNSSFGTGAVKVTPAHDPNDYEIGERHGLEKITVIGFDARMSTHAGAYAGQTREAARQSVVRDLQALNLVEKIEPYGHSVGHCERTGSVIEPLLSEQWFVAMKDLARPVADAIKMNRVHYHPPRFAATSLDWMENIRDWCVSRQLWWGHRIPVWYGPNGEIEVSIEPIVRNGWHQDEDVLDTWFSSALWPFTVLGWPDDFQKELYPTSVLITARDILNLWVSRMILTSLHFVDDQIPFHNVLVHPTIQDAFGLRMSKSKGTGIDPLELVNVYGADATRFGLLQLATASQDVRFIDAAEVALGEAVVRRHLKEEGRLPPLIWDGKPNERYPQMQAARNFANKIWNAARFVLSSNSSDETSEIAPHEYSYDGALTSSDDLASRWILSRLTTTVGEVTRALDNYEFDAAASTLYQFVWNDFCDWFVELSKPKMRAGDAAQIALLSHVLEITMRLLHPFMPFLSEDIWQRLPKSQDAPASVCIASWPQIEEVAGGVSTEEVAQAERDFVLVQDIVRAARNLRQEADLPLRQKLNLIVTPLSPQAIDVLREGESHIAQLANLSSVSVLDSQSARPQNALSTALPEAEVFLPMEGLIDVERETARLEKERDSQTRDLERISAKLDNPQFTDKAPRAVVEKEAAKRAELQDSLRKIEARLHEMK